MIRQVDGSVMAIVTELTSAYGARLSTNPAMRDQHGRGEAHHPGASPDAVFFAESTAEVAHAVALCESHGVPVIAFGAGSSLEGNVSAVAGGLTINLTRMARILRVNQDDMDCVVEAGVTRLQLNRELRDTGLFFPLDPGADATIGGMASTRASGTNAVRYGTMREAVLGLTVVLSNGQIIRTGGRARKSAAGYDLTRLFVGSEGTLGVITEITVRLHGTPEAVRVVSCHFPSLDRAVQAVVSIMQMSIPIARVELLDAAQVRAVNAYSNTTLPEADTLLFEMHGTPRAVDEQLEQVTEVARMYDAGGFAAARTPEECSHLWKARHAAIYATIALRPGSKAWTTDVCVPLGKLAQCIRETQAIVARTDIPATVVGHVGDGNFHVIFALDPNDPREVEEVGRISGALVELALSLEGTSTGEHGIGTGKIRYMRAEHGDAVHVMRWVKQALDPRGVLNPGKILPNMEAGGSWGAGQ